MDISKQSREKFLPSILICVSFIILLISSVGDYHGRDWGSWLDSFFLPGNWVISKVGKKINDVNIFIKEFKNVWEENQKLNKENSFLMQRTARITELESENNRLNKLLDFSSKFPKILLSAAVIGQDPSNWSQYIIIDKGGKNNITVDMVVITADGLAGRVAKVWPDMSKVQLIIDRNSGVGAMVQRTRANGVASGMMKNICEFKYFDDKEDLQEGDILITSGLGMVYPKGILIGKVTKIEQRSLNMSRYIEITPYVNFSKLEEVFILKKNMDLVWPEMENINPEVE
ncbi:MAG: rod shape-determining protein MreC [bacterium]|nr:rod shape-determining protein MreC [bacterium]